MLRRQYWVSWWTHTDLHELGNQGEEEQDTSGNSIGFCFVYVSQHMIIHPESKRDSLRMKNANSTNWLTGLLLVPTPHIVTKVGDYLRARAS